MAADQTADQTAEYAALLRDHGATHQIAWVPAIGVWTAVMRPIPIEQQVLAAATMTGLRDQIEGRIDGESVAVQARPTL